MRELTPQSRFTQINPLYYPSTSSGIGGINLRNEIDALFNEFGFYVLLRRSNKHLHCSCYDHTYQSADPDCPYCYGSGLVTSVERHICMQKHLGKVVKLQAIGMVADDGEIFYFRYNVSPNVGDHIYKVGWNNTVPTGVQSVYTINNAQDFRGDYGRTEFYSCIARLQPANVSKISISVRRRRDAIDGSLANIPYQYDLLIGE